MPRRHRLVCGLILALCACAAPIKRAPPGRLKIAVLAVRPEVAMSTQAVARLDADLRDLLSGATGYALVDSTATADGLLEVRVAGYGKVKRKWIVILIATGIGEGAVQGVALAQVAGPWAGLGIAIEEVAQETLTWGGGAWAFNKIFTPVILEATLKAAADGRSMWRKTVFVERDRKGIKALPKEQRKNRDARLLVTARKAARELAESLDKAARKRADDHDRHAGDSPAR